MQRRQCCCSQVLATRMRSACCVMSSFLASLICSIHAVLINPQWHQRRGTQREHVNGQQARAVMLLQPSLVAHNSSLCCMLSFHGASLPMQLSCSTAPADRGLP